MISTSKDLIFLLGAGVSVEADIPASATMIKELEAMVKDPSSDFWQFRELYQQVKSAIHYSWGLRGFYPPAVNYNIEVLVNTLLELERNETHPLYPFIATWNSKFTSLAGSDFERVTHFKKAILCRLKEWVQMKYRPKGAYYFGLQALQKECQHPLRIFSLNYDRCVEETSSAGSVVEAGFAADGDQFVWDWRRFDDGEIERSLPSLLLYKMHGSIDWIREEKTDRLLRLDYAGENIRHDKMVIIFGRDIKLEAADPFLFYAYEFRRFCLDSKLIVCVGYGFADEHINKIIGQALRHDEGRRLLVVGPCDNFEQRLQEITQQLKLSDSKQIIIEAVGAKAFLSRPQLREFLLSNFSAPEDAPF